MGDHDRARAKPLLMASREALDRAGRSRALQISKPQDESLPPALCGILGAICLIDLWVNEEDEN